MNNKFGRSLAVLAIFGSVQGIFSYAAFADDNSEYGKLCIVNDPTGTPLNLRSQPNGKIIGKLPNGTEVGTLGNVRDRNGKVWTKLSLDDSETVRGYVLRKFINCRK